MLSRIRLNQSGKVEVHKDCISRYVRYQHFKDWIRTAKTKTRSEIACSRKRLRPQKRTGRKRLGDASAGWMRGGAQAHGPKVVSKHLSMNKKQRRIAIVSSLMYQSQRDRIFLLKQDIDILKTTQGVEWLRLHGIYKKKVLIVTHNHDREWLGFRNIYTVDLLSVLGLNVLDVLDHDCILYTLGAIDYLRVKYSIGYDEVSV